MGSFFHTLANEIISISIVNQDYDFLLIDVAHKF